MRRDVGMKLIVGAVLLAIFAAVYYIIWPNLPQNSTDLRLGDGLFKASLATNENSRAKGLSGTTSMTSNQALLMAYPSSAKWGIWMKDMKIPIDAVWLDGSKKVVYIEENIQPEDSVTKTYVPKRNASYVIELPAGTVKDKAISIGSQAFFDISAGSIE